MCQNYGKYPFCRQCKTTWYQEKCSEYKEGTNE